MRILLCAVLVLLPLDGAMAAAVCHFKTGNAIVCPNAANAATAYSNFGFDGARTNLSYNRALLQQSGCGRAYGATFMTAKIELVNKGRVALPNGWVGVSSVVVNGSDLWYVATDYIAGDCPRHKVETDSAMPDLAH
jgi:hypothetical protein